MRERSVFQIDVWVLAATIALVTIGILFIYSSGVTSTGILVSREYLKQLLWALTGLVLLFLSFYIVLMKVKGWSGYIFIAGSVILFFTAIFGKTVNGAKSWIGIAGGIGIQPSEFMKIVTILYLSHFFEKNRSQIGSLSVFLKGIGIVAIPMGLIMLQPDLGTTMVFVPIFFVIAYTSGAPKRYIFFLLAIGVIAAVFTVMPAWQTYIAKRDVLFVRVITDKKTTRYLLLACGIILAVSIYGLIALKRRYFFWIIYGTTIMIISLLGSYVVRGMLKEYQIKRLIIFLDPTIDPKGAGWHIVQSLTAIGSGGFSGKGFLRGTQSHYRYLPQQSTDFIFSIISEEWGFLGGALIFLLFGVLIIRGIRIVSSTKSHFAICTGMGIIGMIGFHVLVNTGMAMGLLPITGIPLFFLSYGGSSLWTAMIAIGLLLNIYKERFSY